MIGYWEREKRGERERLICGPLQEPLLLLLSLATLNE